MYEHVKHYSNYQKVFENTDVAAGLMNKFVCFSLPYSECFIPSATGVRP
jgi:hypothetical protein